MSNLPLPPALQHKLDALARHVHRLRWLRGLSLLGLVLAVGFAGVFVLDVVFAFTAETLGRLLIGLAVLAGLVVLFGLVMPLRKRLDVDALAALIERKYPELGERLTSSVELTRDKDKHGAEAFIAHLLQETEQRTQSLVFRHAFPGRSTRNLTALAVLALGLAVLPAFVWTAHYVEFSQRFLLSWFAAPALQFEVMPGDGYAARGRPLSWTVNLHRRDHRIAWPKSANLVLTDAAGRKKNILMQVKEGDAQNNQVFTCALDQVAESFAYYIDAGGTRSPLFKIEAVEPVVLAGKPGLTLTPPPYVNLAENPVKHLDGAGHVSAVEYSQIKIALQFNRPAVTARVKISQEPTEEKAAKSWTVPVELDGDRSKGTIALPMLAPGYYRLALHLEAEQHITTEQDLPELHLRADQAPTFTMLPGFYGVENQDGKSVQKPLQPGTAGQADSLLLLDYGQASAVAPQDNIHLKVGVADEEGLDRVEVEYRINNGNAQSEVIAKGDGALEISVEHLLKLQGKIKQGDTVQFRLKAVDNRQLKAGQFQDADGNKVPAKALVPQAVYYPAGLPGKDHWLTLRVDEKAGLLQEQEIAAQHDAVQKQIEEIKKKIEQERQDLNQLEQFGKNHPFWTAEQTQKLAQLRKDNHAIKSDLVDVALKTLPIPELNPISLQTYKIATGEMTHSDEALMQAQYFKDQAAPRDKELARADQELKAALTKLDALSKINDQLARDRLEEMQIKQLAQKEEDLSKQVAELEKKKPLDDPALLAELAKLQAEQQKVAEQLKQLAEQNPMLQSAQNQMQAQQAQQLAMQAQKLAQMQQGLVQQMEQVLNEQQKSILEEFAKKQKAIADKADKLGQQTTQEAKNRQLAPLNPQPAHQAVGSIQKAAVTKALGEQEMSAKELERLAFGLDTVLMITGDAAEMVQKLLDKQKDLEERLLEEGRLVAVRSSAELRQAVKEIYQGQKAIHEAVQKLATGEQSFALLENHAGQAAGFLKKFDALQAWKEMEQARHVLEQLSRFPPANKAIVKPDQPRPDDPKADAAVQHARQLRDLAKEQWDLRKALQRLLANPDLAVQPGQDNPLENIAQQQKELQQQGKDLMEKLKQLAQSHGDSPEAKKSAQGAAKSGEEAHQAMQKASDQGEKGKGMSAKQAADEAAKLLAQAAKQADQTAVQLGMAKPGSKPDEAAMQDQKEMADSFQKGQEQAEKAQGQLNEGDLAAAAQSMKQAAQSLQQTAKQMAKQMQQMPGMNPAVQMSLASPQGPTPDLKQFGEEGKKHSGKAWGQLPGQLKSKILADLRAQYGEEYAAIIQRYFEAQAELEKNKR